MFFSIPKKIHQTWYKKDIPKPIQKNIDNMKKLNPNYEYFFYDDDDIKKYLEENCDKTINTCFAKLKIGAEKADFFRYIILYYQGGIYLDLDSIINKNLDKLIENKSAVISRETHKDLFLQWCLMFCPKHPILKKTIDLCIDNILNDKHQKDIHKKTGPTVYSKAIETSISGLNNIWEKEDSYINDFLKKQNKEFFKNTLFYKNDYIPYANFDTPEKNTLYTDKPHWREEQKTIEYFSNFNENQNNILNKRTNIYNIKIVSILLILILFLLLRKILSF